jgi:hypothetical protein
MRGTGLAEIYCVGGALLGLWTFVRFPDRSPKGLAGAMLALILATAGTALVPALLTYCIDVAGKAGGVLGLVGVVLPALTGLFWSIACVFRAFSGLFRRGFG